MAETEKISETDRMERASLERAVADVERTLLSYPPGTRPFFNAFLQNARARLGFLEKKIHETEREQHERAPNEVALVQLANKETALNAQEKETYSGFLKESFFTNEDFGALEQFYAKSWDRLSEGGKNQMSRRVWEGICREEYTFSELPQLVREKEAKQAYKLLRDSTIKTENASRIPESDRMDFIRAYEAGKREEADKILERESFRKNMFRDTDSKEHTHAAAEVGRDADGGAIEKRFSGTVKSDGKPDSIHESGKKADLDLSGLNLDGVKMAEAPAAISSAGMPIAEASVAKGGPSLRGS